MALIVFNPVLHNDENLHRVQVRLGFNDRLIVAHLENDSVTDLQWLHVAVSVFGGDVRRLMISSSQIPRTIRP
jgi:hypothetical protein